MMLAPMVAAVMLPLSLLQNPMPPGAPPTPSPRGGWLFRPRPPRPPPIDTTEALPVFLDCQPFICDLDFLRTEISFVNYMRDRHDAQVYVLVTTQATGSGGTEYTLTFIGQGQLAGRADTLVATSLQTDGPDQIRHRLARVLALGLVRYVMGTEVADHLSVRLDQRAAGIAARQGHDPWNYWVFTISASGFFQGQQATSSRSLFGRLRADRVTDDWKIDLGVSASSQHNFYQLDSVTTFTSDNSSYNGNALVVRSLGRHWAAGGQATIGSSTFSNLALRLRGGPAIEYDVFPYGESTRRLLSINYSLGAEYASYSDTTIFLKTSEAHPVHSLSVSLSATQPWGNTSMSISASQYLHDLSKKDVSFFGGLTLRLVRGLSFNFFGNYTIVRDQLYLPKAGATQQQILVQQRQLATNYTYFVSVGLSYTFGSIFNNVVNPRFGGSGGTFFISN